MSRELRFRHGTGRRWAAGVMAVALVGGLAVALTADTVTTTTYYPSPAGVYNKITTTGATVLARDGGGVGIGTTDPKVQLDMTGMFRPGRLASDPAGEEGAIHYNTTRKDMRVFQDGRWRSLGNRPDFDSGWVRSTNLWSDTIVHGLNAVPMHVQIWFSPSNPPAGRIYNFSSGYGSGLYFSADYGLNDVRISHYYWKYFALNLATWSWDVFSSGYYRVLVWI